MLKKVILILIFLFSNTISAENIDSFKAVNDLTNSLSQEETNKITTLIENKTLIDVNTTVVIIPTKGNDNMYNVARNLFIQWQSQFQDADNGALILIAKDDREIFIATGKDIKSKLSDENIQNIIYEKIVPYFKTGNMAKGIYEGVLAIKTHIRHKNESNNLITIIIGIFASFLGLSWLVEKFKDFKDPQRKIEREKQRAIEEERKKQEALTKAENEDTDDDSYEDESNDYENSSDSSEIGGSGGKW
nr:TPM domain-containing protein [uncultured Haemophilus sp.]